MSEAKLSACAVAAGMCMRDPTCEDVACPERPCTPCSCSLQLGTCPSPYACVVPLVELQPINRRLFTARRRFVPITREARGRLVGALLALGGLGLFWREILRAIFTST